jgi:serine kinase of HPr protein (carbohydrate metabolism regulator)
MTQPVKHQATSVAVAGRAVMIEGPPGTGKSSLVLALIDRGAILIGDDGVELERDGARLLASPVPETAGLLEVRNLGIVTMPTAARIVVALVIVLDREAPRFITEAEAAMRHGAALPLVRLWPESPVLALRAELALRTYGLAPGA